MRAILALSLCTALAGAAAHGSACAPGDECWGDDAFFIQHRAHDQKLHDEGDLPNFDFGKIAEKVQEAAKGATDKANDLVSGALETVGGNINSTLGSFVKKVNGFAAHVNETASSVKVGVASVLAQAFDRAPNGTVSEEDRARVFSMLGQADEVVQTALVSVTGATATLDVVPQAVANVTEKAKDSLGVALLRCRGFSEALDGLKRFFDEASRNFTAAPKQASLLQLGPRHVAHADAAESVLMSAVWLQVAEESRETPSGAMATLRKALEAAQEELSGFSTSLDSGFDSLSTSVEEFSKDRLGATGSAKVLAAFDAVRATAKGGVDRANVAFAQLLGSISDGAALAGLPNAGRGLAPSHALVVAALLAASLAAN
mmetsp:Transcript_53804/g.149249  ORF Transcript_53804/g.149249 Transcript_53804/m.149249 type:complete len:374 (-) Transcript_53804:227-1348(-)